MKQTSHYGVIMSIEDRNSFDNKRFNNNNIDISIANIRVGC